LNAATRSFPCLRSIARGKAPAEGGKVSLDVTLKGGRQLGLFTIEFEIGPQTRAMIERVTETALVRLELGLTPETRQTIADAVPAPSKGKAREAIEGLIGKDPNEEQ
jgi:hypothetical protein